MGLHEDVVAFLSEEFEEGAYPDELLVDGFAYKYVFSDLVREAVTNGSLMLEEIELAVLMIPKPVWNELYRHDEYYYHCNQTDLQLLIYLDDLEFTVKMAYRNEEMRYA